MLWGTVVPALFLRPASLVVLSLPSRRLVRNAVPMIAELRALGASLAAVMDASPLRIAVAISADLAHTHLCSGPYGCNANATVFDSLVATWLRHPSNTSTLLVDAAAVAVRALRCVCLRYDEDLTRAMCEFDSRVRCRVVTPAL